MALTDPQPPEPPAEPERLFIADMERTALKGTDDGAALLTVFSRPVTDEELEQMRRLPPATQIAKDAQHFAERVILAELGVRLFRVLVLGNFVHADTPAAMDWLRDWVDGNLEGHGPMGSGPMIWPDRIPFVAALLRQWGFQPTPTVPPYVMRQPGGPGVVMVEQGKPS